MQRFKKKIQKRSTRFLESHFILVMYLSLWNLGLCFLYTGKNWEPHFLFSSNSSNNKKPIYRYWSDITWIKLNELSHEPAKAEYCEVWLWWHCEHEVNDRVKPWELDDPHVLNSSPTKTSALDYAVIGRQDPMPLVSSPRNQACSSHGHHKISSHTQPSGTRFHCVWTLSSIMVFGMQG